MDASDMDSDLETVVEDNADQGGDEDQAFDTFEDALDALQDDEEGADDEQPEDPEGEAAEDEAETEEEADSEGGDVVIGEDPETGEPLTLAQLREMREGNLRHADYTKKTTELAEQRRAVEAVEQQYAERVRFTENALQNLHGYLESLIPAEPPLSLAQSNPSQYQYQRALRESALAELNNLTLMREEVGQHQSEASQADYQRYRETEDAALVKAMPHLSDPARRAAFDKAVMETAQEFGFTQDEVSQTADHRIRQLVHYARLGKRAEHNRNNAKRRTETPKQGKAKPSRMTAKQSKNRQGMQRLSKSGSIEDALSIDFD